TVGLEDDVHAIKSRESFGQAIIARVFQLIHGEQPAGAAWMAGDENEIVFRGAFLAPFQIMLDLRGLAVFVSAKEADIQVEPRVFEVIRITTEESNLLFGREDQPDIGVAFEAIKVIEPSLVKRDHIAAQTGFV